MLKIFQRGSKRKLIMPLFWFAVTAGIVSVLFLYVDLKPKVETNFFFSSDDPQFRADKRINEMFPEPSQIVMSAIGDIQDPVYQQRTADLTKALAEIEDVYGVKSLASGPAGLKDAMDSPLWRRILISEDGTSANLFVYIKEGPGEKIIPKIEAVMDRFDGPGFQLKVSGMPYVTELIRRNLLRDFQTFSVAAFFVFGGIIFLVFRSGRIPLGTLLSCVNASSLTLIISQSLNIKLGILTANLSTIVFVLTLSHIVFLTFNWKEILAKEKPENPGGEAVRVTIAGSFWSMLTTLLGFLSLLFVQAKPLQQLGIMGAIGTVIAFASAYLIFPWFLTKDLSPVKREEKHTKAGSFWLKKQRRMAFFIFVVTAFLATGLWSVNTDPSLIAYFKKGSELRDGLEYIDQRSGSSLLKVVVRDRDGATFNTTQSFEKLWKLQGALERDPEVGSVISLPVIMAEAKRAPFAVFLKWEWLLKILESPQFDEAAKRFITRDRLRGIYLLTMRESQHDTSRSETIERVTKTVQEHGFIAELIGGVYMLQGKMAELVRSSLVEGLGILIFLFLVIGLFLSGSPQVVLALFVSLCVIPVCMLGAIGFLNMPLDVISSPAANIAIGIGVDAMMHSLIWSRRFHKKGYKDWQAWAQARLQLWKPVTFSALIICAGFGIFGLSNFPPTQRFGFSVVLGSVMSPLATLFVLPYLAVAGKRSKGRHRHV